MAATEIPASATVVGAEKAKAKAPGVMMPLLAVFILMPALAYGLTAYVLIPKLRASLPAATAATGPAQPGSAKKEEKSAAAPASQGGSEGSAPKAEGASKKGGESDGPSIEFKDVIVNLSGAMGTRYLKTSFTVTGSDSHALEVVKTGHQKLLDIALGVLSSRTLNDLDNSGAKNAIREELIAKFNHALGVEIVEEIYFSEFVVQ